jgi:hypothetical protein
VRGTAWHRGDRGAARFSRCERRRAIAIDEHTAAARARAIERARGTDLEALHPAGERVTVLRVDHELDGACPPCDAHDAKPVL